VTTKDITTTLIAILSTAVTAHAGDQDKTLFDFDSESSAKGWMSVNDTVMGGGSSSMRRVTEGGALEFSGTVSLDNNGGFASLRKRMNSVNLSEYDELIIRVRGDGQRYALSVQTDYPIMAGAYYFSFQTTKDTWQEVRAPLSAFEAQSFGRALLRAPKLNARDIRELGFIISDKQEGTFRLEVDWIKALMSGSDNDKQTPARTEAESMIRLMEMAIARGVPMFNSGQPEACADIYEVTTHCLVELSSGDVPPEIMTELRNGLAKAEQTVDPAQKAWALRSAFDASLKILNENIGE
jgi:monofunctional biosynthetic peptidoglycan transglycosylase